MKSKKGLCIILSAVMMVTGFAACGKKDKTKVKTNGAGESYVEVTDEKGNAVTDKSGNKVTSKVTDKNGDKNNNKGDKNDEVDPQQAIKDFEEMGNAFDPDVLENYGQADKSDLYTPGTTISQKTNLRDEVVIKKIKNGKFTLSMKMVSGNTESPLKMTSDGKKLAADMDVGGVSCRVIIDSEDMYITFPKYKYYYKMGDELGGDDSLNFKEIIGSIDGEDEFVGSSKVKINGTEYICEEYKNSDGSVTKYYFQGNEWKRMEAISGDDVIIYNVTSLTGNVDSSIFDMKGYKDLQALLGALPNQ